jgi:hypothetical protein
MRAILLPVFATLVLWLPAAQAQTEDEEILEESADTQESEPRQSRRDKELDDEDLDAQVFYSGMSIERVSTDYDNLGEATNLGATLGFRVPTIPWVGLEIDIGQTIIPGEYRDPDPGSAGTPDVNCPGPLCVPGEPARPAEHGAADGDGQEFGMQALGIGLAFKSLGKFYVTGKYAYRYIATSNDTVNEDRSGKGLGFGVGYRWGRGLSGVELGYKELAKDVEAIGLTFFVRTGGNR